MVKEKSVYEVGKGYFLRTVTMNYAGKLVRETEHELVFKDCAWVADTGTRLSDFLKGEFNSSSEIEPFPSEVIVPKGGIIDVTPYSVKLPLERR